MRDLCIFLRWHRGTLLASLDSLLLCFSIASEFCSHSCSCQRCWSHALEDPRTYNLNSRARFSTCQCAWVFRRSYTYLFSTTGRPTRYHFTPTKTTFRQQIFSSSLRHAALPIVHGGLSRSSILHRSILFILLEVGEELTMLPPLVKISKRAIKAKGQYTVLRIVNRSSTARCYSMIQPQ